MQRRLLPLSLCLASVGLSLLVPAGVFARDQDAKPTHESIEIERDSKKDLTILVLDAKPETVHAAALDALGAIGCDVKRNTPTNIEGRRPNCIGVSTTSGGERILISVRPAGEGKTELRVTTKKTNLGIEGQKRWNDDIAEFVRNAVS